MKSEKEKYRKSSRFEIIILFLLQDTLAGGGAVYEIDVVVDQDCTEVIRYPISSKREVSTTANEAVPR